MRVARITGEGESYYHVLSRVVDRRLILDDAERERYRDNFGVKRTTGARPARGIRWKQIYTARRLQRAPIIARPVC